MQQQDNPYLSTLLFWDDHLTRIIVWQQRRLILVCIDKKLEAINSDKIRCHCRTTAKHHKKSYQKP